MSKKTRGPGSDPAPSRLRGWRLWLARALLLAGAPCAVMLALESGLRLAGYGYPTAFFVRIPERDAVTANDRFAYLFFHPAMARAPVVCDVATMRPPGTYRIFLLGGSAARGTPDAAYGVGRVLEVMLRERRPDLRVEVVNTAMTAINSHAAVSIAEDCAALGGDLFIVYMGNNEVVGPYGPGTVFQSFSAGRSAIRAAILLRSTSTGQLAGDIARSLARGDAAWTSWAGREMFERNRVAANDPRMAAVYRHFQANLEAICSAARRAGAAVILCTVPVNLKDCPPFASLHSPDLDDAARERFDSTLRMAGARQREGAHAEAVKALDEARLIDGGFAEVYFRLGASRLALGDARVAREDFLRACDLDALRFRADTRINAVIREVAARVDGATLVDAAQRLAPTAGLPHDIPGAELFYEHVHLTFEGRYAFAALLAEAVFPRLPPSPAPESVAALPSRERCAQLLALTAVQRTAMAEEILEMINGPPFTGQSEHAERCNALRGMIADLKGLHPPGEARRLDLEAFRAAVAREPLDIEFRRKLVESLGAAGAYDEALDHISGLIARIPDIAAWHLARARLYRDAGKDAEARAAFREAIRLRPLSPDAHRARNELGHIMLKAGETADAAAMFEEALRYSPASWSAASNLGTVLAALERHKEAAELFKRSIRLRPTYARAHFNLAALFAREGRAQETLTHLREAVKSEPDFAEAHEALGQLLSRLSDFRAAVVHLETACRLAPGRADLREALEQARAKAANP